MDRARLRTFLLGGAAGLLAGVLIAPRSGRELRGSLTDRAGEARERGRESYFETREGMRERRAALLEGRGLPADQARQAPPEETTTATPRPRLRDVSEDPEGPVQRPVEEPATGAERSEELRRKVRETRERLRGKQDLGRGPEA
ncbi:MAG: YtxH domain-containing protein [Actinomycetota bacterium]|nr:YtxH domain-containing protein [Actinomycetota bacterium]